ncbi:MAG: NrdH-redoxin [Candidatus Ryanbacteria bacterium RIFCSPHIGHO2_02_FULL_45_17b]|uniref:NrdH-redoxin n=1 Tax=Candidatus Ryanbacteria bacterium RIFCSPHIGHO2_01_FULL_45_22 TaxID=1802114 RepID=A0A1G2G274_9BACT|nr:MAG: NrdH-redoxin [Candidatus Ryanbacteria bacterium RIFCSPHIGHO2_01_FULL_45_22]OGZ47033.1 MAG: NrdH-redoxin [Candidatus Ryanbacteria bacterium RIFCSPHIGHO2_02_FULL_45_17b]
MKKVAIYTTPTCVYCKMAKELFGEHGIEYTEYNVAQDAEKRNELIERTGQMGVPVITIDNEVVIGFDEEKLRVLLGI